MEEIRLPIDVVPGHDPPVFRWRQVVDTINGRQVIEHQEALSPTVELAVERLITIAKQLLRDNATLQGQVKGFADRIAVQSELLSKKAEAVPPVQVPAHGSSLKKKGG